MTKYSFGCVLGIGALAFGCIAPMGEVQGAAAALHGDGNAGPQFPSVRVVTGTVRGEPFTSDPNGAPTIALAFSAGVVEIVPGEPTDRENLIQLSIDETLAATSNTVSFEFSEGDAEPDRGDDGGSKDRGDDKGDDGSQGHGDFELDIQGGESTSVATRFIRIDDETFNRYTITSTVIRVTGPAEGTSEPTVFVWESVDNPGIDSGLLLLSHGLLDLDCGEAFTIEVDLVLRRQDESAATVSMSEEVVFSTCTTQSAELLEWVTAGHIDAPRK